MNKFAAISLVALVALVAIVAVAQANGYGYSAPSYGHPAPSYGQNYERKTGFKTVSIRRAAGHGPARNPPSGSAPL
jgi:hypothetical protein